MSKEDFLKGMKILGTAYNKEFDEEQLTVWYEMLGEYSLEDFSSAIKELIKTEKYMPSIAHITDYIARRHLEALPDANEEWSRVINAVHVYGSYREEEALNSLCQYTAKIVRLIGYQRICMATPEEQVWNKKEFLGEYSALSDKLISNLQIGISEEKMLNG